jgi:hypothetical protein
MKEKYRHPQFSTKGLVAYYKLFAGLTSTASVFDYALNGFTGTPTGTGIAPAYPGFRFNGTDDLIDIGIGPTSVKGISIWTKVSSVAGNEYPIDLNGGGSWIGILSGVVSIQGLPGHALYVDGIKGTSNVTTVDTGWHHIMVTDSSDNNATDLEIGRVAGNSYYEGLIGEVMLYDRVLTQAEVQSVCELTKWRYPNN